MAKDKDANADVGTLPFEKALAELETIVQRMEQGDVALDESIRIYERGEALKKRCEMLLRDAEARVEKIALDAKGAPTGSAPLDPA
jgi:exodeoxyribonuclease VII small subunit